MTQAPTTGTMSIRLIGQPFVTAKGNVHTINDWGLNDEYWAMPANAYRRSQPAELAIHFDRDQVGPDRSDHGRRCFRGDRRAPWRWRRLDRVGPGRLLVDGPCVVGEELGGRRAAPGR